MKGPEKVREIPWRLIAMSSPELVQWIIAKHGPLPEMATRESYEQYRTEYQQETNGSKETNA